jgi:hypothetical protein
LGLDAVIEVPDIASSNSFIRDVVVASLEKKKEEDAAMAVPYEETIDAIDSFVDAVKDTSSLNDAFEKVSGLKPIWDSKLYAWQKITAKAKEIGATFDKAKRCFKAPARRAS